MKQYIAGFLVVALILIVLGLLLYLAVNKTSERCAKHTQTLIAISHNDPQDFPGVLDMYKDSCN